MVNRLKASMHHSLYIYSSMPIYDLYSLYRLEISKLHCMMPQACSTRFFYLFLHHLFLFTFMITASCYLILSTKKEGVNPLLLV